MKKASRVIDLRSDTFTQPTDAMRSVIASAKVGDDVFGEDPTVNELQRRVAELLKKEDSLFVPSGVMANQIAIKCHTSPGDEIVVESESHIFNYETAAPSVISGVQMNVLKGTNGILVPEQIELAIRPNVYYMQSTSLVCLENTHNMAGGIIYPLKTIREINSLCRREGLQMHLDGARLWNAWIATDIHPSKYAQYFDSISVCFSKGLGAPVGSVVAGSSEFIAQARKYRKILGGGMRQAGIIAAGALYALNNHVERLKIDHENAKSLAIGLNAIDPLLVNPEMVQTNIVIISLESRKTDAEVILRKLKKENVLLTPVNRKSIRAVTHMGVDRSDIDQAMETFKKIFS